MTAQINMRSMGASPQNGSETTLTPKRSGQSSGTDNSRAPVMKGRITAVLSLTSSSLLLTTLSERGRAALRSHYGPRARSAAHEQRPLLSGAGDGGDQGC